MMHLPTTITAAPAPTTDEARRAHAAAESIWRTVEKGLDNDNDYWTNMKAQFRNLLAITRYMHVEEGHSAEEIGWWINGVLTGGHNVPAIDQHKPQDLAEGVEIIRAALLKGQMPEWLMNWTGLYPTA